MPDFNEKNNVWLEEYKTPAISIEEGKEAIYKCTICLRILFKGSIAPVSILQVRCRNCSAFITYTFM